VHSVEVAVSAAEWLHPGEGYLCVCLWGACGIALSQFCPFAPAAEIPSVKLCSKGGPTLNITDPLEYVCAYTHARARARTLVRPSPRSDG
jgi:hypothetical protein